MKLPGNYFSHQLATFDLFELGTRDYKHISINFKTGIACAIQREPLDGYHSNLFSESLLCN